MRKNGVAHDMNSQTEQNKFRHSGKVQFLSYDKSLLLQYFLKIPLPQIEQNFYFVQFLVNVSIDLPFL